MQYAVICIDAVAMVEHFHDADALKEAQAIHAKKYLVYLDHVSPIHHWYNYRSNQAGKPDSERVCRNPRSPKGVARGTTTNLMAISDFANFTPHASTATVLLPSQTTSKI